MSAESICREYRLAKNKPMQIKILSHENLVSEECIALILFEHGEIQKSRERKALLKTMEMLEKHIRCEERKLKTLNSRYALLADFLKTGSVSKRQAVITCKESADSAYAGHALNAVNAKTAKGK